MLAFSNEGERARMFCMETAVSHPFVLLADSWAESMEQMVESNTTRVVWTIGVLTGHQWARQTVKPPPMGSLTPRPRQQSKPKSALKIKSTGNTWAKVATDPGGLRQKKISVRVDEAALKAKLQQVQISCSKNVNPLSFPLHSPFPKPWILQ
jgi:hypothetical protein